MAYQYILGNKSHGRDHKPTMIPWELIMIDRSDVDDKNAQDFAEMPSLEDVPTQLSLTDETNAGTSLIQTKGGEMQTQEVVQTSTRTVELVWNHRVDLFHLYKERI